MSTGRYPIDVYGAHVHIATDDPSWDRLANRFEIDEEPGLGMTSLSLDTYRGNAPHLVIYLDPAAHSSRADLVSTVAHEAAHAASILLDHLGHRLRGEDEPHAYLAGYVARCIWTHLEKRESA